LRQVLPLLLTLITEKTFFDSVTADLTKTASKDRSRGGTTNPPSRPKWLFELGLNIIRSLSLKTTFSLQQLQQQNQQQQNQQSDQLVINYDRFEFLQNPLQSYQNPVTYEKPVVLLRGGLTWMAHSTNVNSRNATIDNLYEGMLLKLQFMMVHFLSTVNSQLISASLIPVLLEILSLLLEIHDKYSLSKASSTTFITQVSEYFPLKLKEEEEKNNENPMVIQDVQILNLTVCALFFKFGGNLQQNNPSLILAREYLQNCFNRLDSGDLFEKLFQLPSSSSTLSTSRSDKERKNLKVTQSYFQLLFVNLSLALENNNGSDQGDVSDLNQKLNDLLLSLRKHVVNSTLPVTLSMDVVEEEAVEIFSTKNSVNSFAKSLCFCHHQIISRHMTSYQFTAKDSLPLLTIGNIEKTLASDLQTVSSIVLVFSQLHAFDQLHVFMELLKQLLIRLKAFDNETSMNSYSEFLSDIWFVYNSTIFSSFPQALQVQFVQLTMYFPESIYWNFVSQLFVSENEMLKVFSGDSQKTFLLILGQR
jgi:hypothetical protein